ncbi:MAG: electron transfer flavoprotein subunit beta/FixA family protein [Syntrophales bacterium]
MPNIVACFKWVIDEAYIRKGASGALDFSAVDYKISDYDRNAIEEAARLKGLHGGSVTVLTAGAPEAAKGVKDALSRGADQAFFASDPIFNQLESSQTAAILGEIIRSRIPYDLIICGEGSSDQYAQQVGPRLAEKLGIPCISYVQKLTIGEGGRVLAERRVEEGVEVVEAPLPVLVTVLPEINTPRIPGVKDTLMASKKPVVTIKKEELPAIGAARLQTLGMTATRMERNCEKFAATPEGIAGFVEALQKKGVIS